MDTAARLLGRQSPACVSQTSLIMIMSKLMHASVALREWELREWEMAAYVSNIILNNVVSAFMM